MEIARMTIFFIIMLVLPYLIGLCMPFHKKESAGQMLLLRFNFGNLLMYALFEALCLAGTFLVTTLKRLTAAYFLALFLVCAAGIAVRLAKRNKKQEEEEAKPEKTRIRALEWVMLCVVIGLILYQMVYVCINMHIDEDDAYYVGTAVTSYFSNTISALHPYTGAPATVQRLANYALSPYPIYWAMWAKLTGLHPTILMHSVLPALSVMWSYAAYGLIAGVFCKKLQSKCEFLLFVILLQMFGGYSGYTAVTYLFCRGWQGKSVLAAVMLPILWYLWIRIRREPKDRCLWLSMALAAWAACLCSTMAMFLGPALFFAFGLEYLIEKRKILPVVKLAACSLPFVLLAGLELYLLL